MIDPADVEAIKRTLLNPAELIFPGRLVQEGAADALIVCCAVKDAILYERPGATLTPPVLISHTEVGAEFEALCEKDGWVCVVVPGFGLGWVNKSDVVVLLFEEEPCATSKSQNAGRYELMLRTYSKRKPSRPGYRVFLECVGAQLGGLDLSEFGELRGKTNDVLHATVTHCIHLKHLALKGCGSMDENKVAPLLATLRGNLGSKLDSLNLNDSFITHETLDQLARILSNTEKPPALQELCIDAELYGCFGHECLFNALHANKILAILELPVAEEDFSMRQSSPMHCKRFDFGFGIMGH